MSARAERTAVTLVLLAAMALLLWLTLPLTPSARLVPLIVVIPTLALLLLELAAERVAWLGAFYRRFEGVDLYGTVRVSAGASRAPRRSPEAETRERQEGRTIAWMAGLLALGGVFGLVAGLPMFVAAYLRYRSGETRTSAVAFGVGTWIFLQAVLTPLVGSGLYAGLLTAWLAR